MSVPHGCTDDREVVETFKDALKQRIGSDRYQMWFGHGVEFAIEPEGDPDAEIIEDVNLGSAVPGDVEADTGATKAGATKAGATKAGAQSAADGMVMLRVHGQFALDRIRKNLLQELRGAAMQACGTRVRIQLCLDQPPAEQAELPLDKGRAAAAVHESASQRSADSNRASSHKSARSHNSRRTKERPISRLLAQNAERPGTSVSEKRKREHAAQANSQSARRAPAKEGKDAPRQLELPNLVPTQSSAMNAANFIAGSCNELAYTAMRMVCQEPSTASPLFVCGPTGSGKTHLLNAIADQLRRRHRMKRVVLLSAEQFTNDFIRSVGKSGITAFRRRYREVDALLVDGVQFLGSKQATLREMLYTVETLTSEGRPLIFSVLQPPPEIPGLSQELIGRFAAGLVCPVGPLDAPTRDNLMRRLAEQRCKETLPEALVEQITSLLPGDGRAIMGVVNLIAILEKMHSRLPTFAELHRFGGEQLRAANPSTSLTGIESAVCELFQLPPETLRSRSQTRTITEPRMLAMYLSRQLTSSAYAEIARHFGGKSHSTAIAAEKNVKCWIKQGKTIGRGQDAIGVQAALDRVDSRLRSG